MEDRGNALAGAAHFLTRWSSAAACVVALTVMGCGSAEVEEPMTVAGDRPDIQALNAFYYYEDVDAAWAFYRDVLGFETAADFGFAKIMRVAPASYLTLVDAARGMHSADEPKSVTLAIVTETVEAWYAYLVDQGVPMMSSLTMREGSAHDGFVAVDPEGYFLEFEWFNEHAENVLLTPRLARGQGLRPVNGSRPPGLTVHGTVFWLYYDDLPPVEAFYEELLGVDLLVDQGWAKVYPASATGYVGLVDASRGLHQATTDKAVTLSFITSDVEGWLVRARSQGVRLRSEDLGTESDRVRTLVGFDPTGYYLEWDTFLDRPGNDRLLELLAPH